MPPRMGALPTAVRQTSPPDNNVAVGIVTAISPAGAITVRFRGTDLQRVGVTGGYVPSAGDTVSLIRQDSSWLITGRIDVGSAISTGLAGVNIIPNIQFTSTLGQPYTNLAVEFRKARNQTRLLVRVDGSAFSFNASIGWTLSIDFGGSNVYEVCRMFFNTTFEHHFCGAFRLISGLDAGTYTAQVTARISAAGTVQADTNDTASLLVQEVGG